jgi:hypothetical protein
MPPPSRPTRAPRLDAANVAGLTDLMNPQHVRGGARLRDAEADVMGRAGNAPAAPSGSAGRAREANAAAIYDDEINALARDLGIDLGETATARPPAAHASTPGARAPASSGPGAAIASGWRSKPPSRRSPASHSSRASTASTGSAGSGSYSGSGSGSYTGSESGSGSGSGSYSGSGSEYGSESGSGSYTDSASDAGSAVGRLDRGLGIDGRGGRSHADRHRRVPSRAAADYPADRHGGRGGRGDHGDSGRADIEGVLGGLRGEHGATARSQERERDNDMKAGKLEQISQLMLTLDEEGVDCSAVSRPTLASDMSEIDSVLNVLRLKNDRNRYSTLAEEVILGAAEAVATVFDGTRTIPVLGWTPNYTGYPATVNMKLHRMRYETSQVVGGIISRHNFGATTRIVLELLPSFFLYPKTQQRQRGEPSLGTDRGETIADARGALARIREVDERSSDLNDMRRV